MKLKIGRLYFQFILNSELDTLGYKAIDLARIMHKGGLIVLSPDESTYSEVNSTRIPKRKLVSWALAKFRDLSRKEGFILTINDGRGYLKGNDKRTYYFDESCYLEDVHKNQRVTFNQDRSILEVLTAINIKGV